MTADRPAHTEPSADQTSAGQVDQSETADDVPADHGAERAEPRPATAAELATWEGLPAETVFLVSELDLPPPMRTPPGMWGLIVLTVDIRNDTGPPELFAGHWEPEQPVAGCVEGDVGIRLPNAESQKGRAGAPDAASRTAPGFHDADHTTVELLIAYRGAWHPAGRWNHADVSWPTQVAPAAATLMRLHTDLFQAAPARRPRSPAAPPVAETPD